MDLTEDLEMDREFCTLGVGLEMDRVGSKDRDGSLSVKMACIEVPQKTPPLMHLFSPYNSWTLFHDVPAKHHLQPIFCCVLSDKLMFLVFWGVFLQFL